MLGCGHDQPCTGTGQVFQRAAPDRLEAFQTVVLAELVPRHSWQRLAQTAVLVRILTRLRESTVEVPWAP